MRSFLLSVAAVATLVACATHAPTPAPIPRAEPVTTTAPAGHAPTTTVVPERFVTAETPADELDSVATWTTEDGRTRAIVTAKSSHQLVVFDGDSGERLHEVGTKGEAPGQFRRPNGIAVYGDLAFVVERDNHRVQVLALPDLTPVAIFGASDLRSPYGLWINEVEPGDLDVYVTDNFMYGPRFDELPPLPELAQRVKRFRVDVDGGRRVRARLMNAFGDVTAAASLHTVESIAGDPENDRLLIADEDEKRPSTLREYSLDGRYSGRSLPQDVFAAQAEGVVLWACAGGEGYWIAVDQLAPHTIFHVFDRRTLAPRGSFEGRVTAHTDGVALHAASTPSFPAGVLYAVHDDRALAAFDLRDVARALGLSERCTQ